MSILHIFMQRNSPCNVKLVTLMDSQKSVNLNSLAIYLMEGKLIRKYFRFLILFPQLGNTEHRAEPNDFFYLHAFVARRSKAGVDTWENGFTCSRRFYRAFILISRAKQGLCLRIYLWNARTAYVFCLNDHKKLAALSFVGVSHLTSHCCRRLQPNSYYMHCKCEMVKFY